MFFFQTKSSCARLSMREAAQEIKQDPAIRLLDVRTRQEHEGGHIPGSANLPLDQINRAAELFPDKRTRLFVYCQSGARSQRACAQLSAAGYTNITNIGGMQDWTGKTERGRIR